MEKCYNPRVGTVTISLDEYRRLLEKSIRCDLIKTYLQKTDPIMLNEGEMRAILDLPDPEAATEA